MGIYIKGLDMPRCNDLCLVISPDGSITKNEYIPTHAEAVAISCPHGRLGDLKALKAVMEIKDSKAGCINALANAPTVIEAEE